MSWFSSTFFSNKQMKFQSYGNFFFMSFLHWNALNDDFATKDNLISKVKKECILQGYCTTKKKKKNRLARLFLNSKIRNYRHDITNFFPFFLPLT